MCIFFIHWEFIFSITNKVPDCFNDTFNVLTTLSNIQKLSSKKEKTVRKRKKIIYLLRFPSPPFTIAKK